MSLLPPCLWMSGLKGDLGVVAEVEPVGVDLSFFDIMSALKFAFMGSVEARSGRFVDAGDIIMTAGWRNLDVDYHDNGAGMDDRSSAPSIDPEGRTIMPRNYAVAALLTSASLIAIRTLLWGIVPMSGPT